MTKMRTVVVPGLGASWEPGEAEIPEVAAGQVLVRVHASGICGTDVLITEGRLSFGVGFPVTLGHEGAGEVVAVGDGVASREIGDRVGIITLQQACGVCRWCRRAEPLDFVTAANCQSPVLTGMNTPGTHADYISAPVEALRIAAEGKVTPMVELFGKEQAPDAYRHTAQGRARFRSVITFV